MPLIIICGTPVSGKTTRAVELKEVYEKKHGKSVEIVSEDEAIVKFGYEKNSTYLDAQKEKRVRGYLKSEVLRLIGKDNVVILDGSNYIKGCRYELYCASKACKSTQCTIYTIRNHDEAWEANKERIDKNNTNSTVPDKDSNTNTEADKDSNTNTEADKDSNTNTEADEDSNTNTEADKDSNTNTEADKDSNTKTEADKAITDGTVKKETDAIDKEGTEIDYNKLPYTQEVFDALTKLRFEEPNSNNRWDSPLFTVQPTDELPLDDIYRVLFEKKPPPPNMSTQNPPLSSNNFLYELDKLTQSITRHILDAKQMEVSGEVKFPDYPNCTLHAGFVQLISPPRLTGLRRQFLTFAKMNYVNDDANKIGRYFIQYLNKSLSD